MKPKKTKVGTLRIKTSDLNVYEKTLDSWKKSDKSFPQAISVIKLFKAHKNFKMLIDKKNPEFFKGQLSPDGMCQGARLNILPDGKVLSGAYSLFAKDLVVHDESSHDHWDVMYKNPAGYCYVYTKKKKLFASNAKYKTVHEFEKVYPILYKHVYSALDDKNDNFALPIYTLLKTYMRVGNEMYYKLHKHKGLTTLKKNDISIKSNIVRFNYIGKDGVPLDISQKFSEKYVSRLKDLLKSKSNDSFVFVNEATGHPLRDTQFEDAFKNYCGKKFYPHIVRSFYATTKAKEFLMNHKSATKEEVVSLFKSIAGTLGHKKYVKKKHLWQENYNVTIHSYIQPEIVQKVQSLVKK